MCSCSQTSLIESQNSYTQPVASPGSSMEELRSAEVVTQQMGHILLEMGNLFINTSPFNEHIDEKTGRLLISLGNKLISRK
ncbi:MAG TPA: hypothetical protein VGK56_08450 [Anaerolineales bacterium]